MNRKTLLEKLVILHHARKIGNIKKTCDDFGISRISYYHIKKSVGDIISSDRPADGRDRDTLIKALVVDAPDSSTMQISQRLQAEHNIQLSHTSVHRALKKLNLDRNERWQYLEQQLKYDIHALELNIRQRRFMQSYNSCFSAYHSTVTRPFERLNLDVIKFRNLRVCIAIDPVTNYAFVLLLSKIERKKILDWLDTEVFPIPGKNDLRLTTVATSKLLLFDANRDGETDYDEFADLLQKHNLKSVDQHAMRPLLDGSVQHCYDYLLPLLKTLSSLPFGEDIQRKLAKQTEHYNTRYQYPYYPNFSLSAAAMVGYYRQYGRNWRGPKSFYDRSDNYVSPIWGLCGRIRNPDDWQSISVYSTWVASLFR